MHNKDISQIHILILRADEDGMLQSKEELNCWSSDFNQDYPEASNPIRDVLK